MYVPSAQANRTAMRIAPLFAGVRGQPALDLDAAIDVMERLAAAFYEETWIREIDLNPLLVRPAGRGALALDLLVVPVSS